MLSGVTECCKGCTVLVICTTSILPLLGNAFGCLLPVGSVVVSLRKELKRPYNEKRNVQTTQNGSADILHLPCMSGIMRLGGVKRINTPVVQSFG